VNSSARIILEEVVVDFPIYNAANRSLKNRVLNAAAGGFIERQPDGVVVVHGLDNISLEIKPGDRIGLVGHNGAGKTTLLRVLSGIYHPTRGRISIQGEVTSLINISLGIDPESTGRENIVLRSAMMGLSPAQTREREEEIIEFSGLGQFIDMPFRTYSSGMQLRLAFSVSTCIRPQILIMDEWLSTGDQDFRERAEKRLKEVVSSTEILVLASHSFQLLEKNCNRLLWLDRGRIRMNGGFTEVAEAYFNTPAHPPVP
jgi:lipopolysaccharide transport system ATP-binding protein